MKTAVKVLLKVILILGLVAIIMSLICFSVKKFKDFTTKPGTSGSILADGWRENGMSDELIGDLTKDEVEEIRKDLKAPTCDDIFEEFSFVDLGSFVVVYRKIDTVGNESFYPNALFVKTDKGLIWEGNLGITAKIDTNWWTGAHDFNSLEFKLNNTNYYKAVTTDISLWYSILGVAGYLFDPTLIARKENIVTFSDFNANFCENFYNCNAIALGLMDEKKELSSLLNKTRDYLWDNIVKPYFFNLEEAKMYADLSKYDLTNFDDSKSADKDASSLFNSYITHLYNNVKDIKDDKSKIISLNDYFAVSILESERVNYPIAEEDRVKYNNAEYYKAYNCNVVAECYFKEQKTNIIRDETTISIGTKDIDVKTPPETPVVCSKLNIKLVNKNNADLSTLDFKTNPVTIQIGDKQVVFNNVRELTKTISLNLYTRYDYVITSNELVFDSYSGVLNTSSNDQFIDLKFTYDPVYIQASVKIMPLSSVSTDDIDLANNPVNITLTGKNGEGIYQFVYSSNDDILEEKTMKLKRGSYTYSIDSNELIFTATTGDLDINTLNRSFVFSYNCKFSSNLLSISIGADTTDYSLPGRLLFLTPNEFLEHIQVLLGSTEKTGFNFEFVFVNSNNEVSKYVYSSSYDFDLRYPGFVHSLSFNENEFGVYDLFVNIYEEGGSTVLVSNVIKCDLNSDISQLLTIDIIDISAPNPY